MLWGPRLDLVMLEFTAYGLLQSHHILLPVSLPKVVYLTNQVKMFQQRAAGENYSERAALCRPCSVHCSRWSRQLGMQGPGIGASVRERWGWENRPMRRSCEGVQFHRQSHTWKEGQQGTGGGSVKQWASARSMGKRSMSWPTGGTYWKEMLGEDKHAYVNSFDKRMGLLPRDAQLQRRHIWDRKGKELAEYKSRPCRETQQTGKRQLAHGEQKPIH